jgi:hypothetical protein
MRSQLAAIDSFILKQLFVAQMEKEADKHPIIPNLKRS